MNKGTYSILLMCAFSAMLGLGIISPFLPEFARQHGANGFWMAMIFAGFGVSRGIIMPIVGILSDRIGRKIFVAFGLLIYTAISLLYVLPANVYTLTLIRLAHGLSAGMIIPIVMAYVGEISEKGREGATMGTLNTMFYLGLGTGPLIGGFLHHHLGVDSVFYAMAALGAVTFLIVVFFLPDIKGPGTEEGSAIKPFNVLIKYNLVKAVLIIAVIITLMMVVFMSFLPSLASEIHVDVHHIGIIISLAIILAGLLQIPFGRFADRLDEAGKLLQIGAGTSVGMIALLLIPFCPDFGALLGAGILLGLGAAISMPALSSISVLIGKKAGMGSWMGIITATMSIGFILTPLISGVVMDHLGIDAVFYVLFMVALFGGLCYFYYIRRRMLGFRQG